MAEAAADDLHLVERINAGVWAVGWDGGDDDRWPSFLGQRQAINWMADQLSREAVFV